MNILEIHQEHHICHHLIYFMLYHNLLRDNDFHLNYSLWGLINHGSIHDLTMTLSSGHAYNSFLHHSLKILILHGLANRPIHDNLGSSSELRNPSNIFHASLMEHFFIYNSVKPQVHGNFHSLQEVNGHLYLGGFHSHTHTVVFMTFIHACGPNSVENTTRDF